MELPFGLPIVLYFGLAAMASGSAILGSLMALSSSSYYGVIRSRSFLVAAIAIGLGGIALVLDLESPAGWWKILAYFNPQSWISLGARIVIVFGLVTGVAWLFFRVRTENGPSAIGIVLALLVLAAGIAVAIYPAYILRQMTARALWASGLLVPLFVVSALHAGQASLTLVSRHRSRGQSQIDSTGWRVFDVFIVLLQVGLVTAYLQGSESLSTEATGFLTTGLPSGYLWIGVIAIGWIVPFGLGVITPHHHGMRLARGLCSLAGVFCLRAWLVLAGQNAGMVIGSFN